MRQGCCNSREVVTSGTKEIEGSNEKVRVGTVRIKVLRVTSASFQFWGRNQTSNGLKFLAANQVAACNIAVLGKWKSGCGERTESLGRLFLIDHPLRDITRGLASSNLMSEASGL